MPFVFDKFTEMKKLTWKLARRSIDLSERPLVMGVLNVTPDSFSDGGKFSNVDDAVRHAEEMIADGADILDIGGESTRPGAGSIDVDEELRRVIPIIERVAKFSGVPLSVDTTKAAVARAALEAGAEIVNDISALRFDYHIADEVARIGAGLVLMHSRGTPATMQRLPPSPDILEEVFSSLGRSINMATRHGVPKESLALDPGIGFGKTPEQNIELIARLEEFASHFEEFPILIGVSRKGFIGRLLANAPADERVHGTMAAVTLAVLNGAHIVRAHDVRAARDTVRVATAFITR